MGSGMRSLHRLSVTKLTNLKQPGYYADGGNLYLRVAPGGTKGWIFRFAIAGRTRDAGLGSYPTVTLVRAREAARRWREMVAAGVDPIEARKRDRQAALVASAKTMTFEQCAKAFITSHSAAWRSVRQARLWSATLAEYVYPVAGALPVNAIDTAFVLKVLERLASLTEDLFAPGQELVAEVFTLPLVHERLRVGRTVGVDRVLQIRTRHKQPLARKARGI